MKYRLSGETADISTPLSLPKKPPPPPRISRLFFLMPLNLQLNLGNPYLLGKMKSDIP